MKASRSNKIERSRKVSKNKIEVELEKQEAFKLSVCGDPFIITYVQTGNGIKSIDYEIMDSEDRGIKQDLKDIKQIRDVCDKFLKEYEKLTRKLK